MCICARQNNWEPQNEDQAVQTKDQSPKDTTAAEKKELSEVSQQPQSKKEAGERTGVSVGGRVPPGGSRTTQPQDEAWNVSDISKKPSADITHLRKITKVQMSSQSLFVVVFFFILAVCSLKEIQKNNLFNSS